MNRKKLQNINFMKQGNLKTRGVLVKITTRIDPREIQHNFLVSSFALFCVYDLCCND